MNTEVVNKRKSLKMGTNEVATKAGISRQYYYQIEKRNVEPTVAVAKKIAGVLGIDWTIFFTNKVNK